jgi:LytS/YehU family sensor histidine kinase
LNSLARFATAESQKIPYAIGHLRRFLRASFDQHDRPFVRLEEELSVVSAYLEIESMRWPGQLEVVQNVDARGLQALIPPFALQGLVENAVVHGRRPAPEVCRVQITISAKHERLEMTITDNGMGVPGTQVEQVFFPERPQVGRLILLRRQLDQSFGKSFKLEIDSEIGVGTTAALSLPLQIVSVASLELKTGRSRIGGASTAQVVVAEKADAH